MTAQRGDGSVVRLSRPPVVQSTIVRSDRDHTFDVFVRTIGVWWPAHTFSQGRDAVRDVTVEPSVGGRVFETWHDGTELDWGRVITWDRPSGFAMTWALTPAPTEVEFAFRSLGPALTRVTVEHRGWEALSEQQLVEDCALPGGYLGKSFAIGWERILSAFETTIGGQT
ncbi:MAG: hypothetical protein QOI42_209 [Frankiaceae bacterium]|nr:hypothetical protein [Frankiaceae bacterium]